MQIVVHRGRAHEDDFLAASVCRHRLGLPVFRSDCTDRTLSSPDFWVLDQGMRLEPELHNFDHHQMDSESCSLTLVLEYFYGGGFRDMVPGLRFIEIADSQGADRAAEFAGVKRETLALTRSPIRNSMLRAFSRIEGEVCGGMLEVLGLIGAEVCSQIEESALLFESLTDGYSLLEVSGLKVLDTTRCQLPPGFTHDQLPTKDWCKAKGVNPSVILTWDPRSPGRYRMVSVNSSDLKFLPNSLSEFTHASGLLTSFKDHGDHATILRDHVSRGR